MSKSKEYKNPNMIPYTKYETKDCGYFNRIYLKDLKLYNTLHKPAQIVFTEILGLLEDTSNEKIKKKIGFMPWEGKINMTQADFAREFNLNPKYISRGIKELKEKCFLVEKDNIFYIHPLYFSHQDYFSKETMRIFNLTYREIKQERDKVAF